MDEKLWPNEYVLFEIWKSEHEMEVRHVIETQQNIITDLGIMQMAEFVW